MEQAEDQGLSVSRFDPDSPENVVDSERTWLVSYQGSAGQAERATSFQFPASKVDEANLIHQRFVDADLAKVGPVVTLESRYGEVGRPWLPWLGGGLVLTVLALGGLLAYLRTRPERTRESRFALPETLTPFSVLGLLREIKDQNGLPAPKLTELNRSIDQLERHYFSDRNGDSDPDLKRIAETWISQAS